MVYVEDKILILDMNVLTFLKKIVMAVKHTPTNEVHIGSKGGKTGCGIDTNEKPTHWVNTNERVTCGRNGCKN